MSLSLARKTKLITKWSDIAVTGLSDPSAFNLDTLTEIYTVTSDLPNFTPNYTTIDRNIIKDSFYDDPPIRGYAEISASLAFELSGAEADNTKPNYHPFLYGALGSVTTVQTTTDATDPLASFTQSGNYWEGTFVVTSVTDLKVGYFIRVYSGSATKLIGEITGIDAATLTLTVKAQSNMIADTSTATLGIAAGDNITTGAIYLPDDTLNLPSLYFDLYRQIAGQNVYIKETYGQMSISELSLPITAGQIVIPSVSLDGSTVSVDDNSGAGYAAPSNTVPDDLFPIIARNNSIWLTIGSDIKDAIAEANITISNTIYKKMVVGSDGPSETARTGRKVSATVNLFYEDNTITEALVNDTNFEISACLPTRYVAGGSSALGDTVTMKLPKCRLANTNIANDSDINKQDLTVSVELPDSSTNSLSKEVCIQVL